ncbi:MAG: decaprenyl-phosphate phosphoribosyltransferase [Actinomycetota bacterium]
MTAPLPTAPGPATARPPADRYRAVWAWASAVVITARPRQWPKNLLVLAAPLAGASLGRRDGLDYALVAVAAFVAASSAVYLVNDTVDAERDRRHPVKRLRPVASGALPAQHAAALAAVAMVAALSAGVWIGEPWLVAAIATYLALSLLYTLRLKHVPVLELAFVASGFVLRALGGAAATHVPPSGWFLLVCSLGAVMVAIVKRCTELRALGPDAARHRPVLRWYRYGPMRAAGRAVAAAMIIAYLAWAAGAQDGSMRAWHLASAVPLAAALFRFDWLAGHAGKRPVEDLIVRDWPMACAELAWLALFTLGL